MSVTFPCYVLGQLWCLIVLIPDLFLLCAIKIPSKGSIKMGIRVSKSAKIRNRHNQVLHLTQDTNRKVTNSQSNTTNESQDISPFPAGDHRAHINRCAQRHGKHKTEKDPQKKYRFGTVSKSLISLISVFTVT